MIVVNVVVAEPRPGNPSYYYTVGRATLYKRTQGHWSVTLSKSLCKTAWKISKD